MSNYPKGHRPCKWLREREREKQEDSWRGKKSSVEAFSLIVLQSFQDNPWPWRPQSRQKSFKRTFPKNYPMSLYEIQPCCIWNEPEHISSLWIIWLKRKAKRLCCFPHLKFLYFILLFLIRYLIKYNSYVLILNTIYSLCVCRIPSLMICLNAVS